MKFTHRFSTRVTFYVFLLSILIFLCSAFAFNYFTYYAIKEPEKFIMQFDFQSIVRDFNHYVFDITKTVESEDVLLEKLYNLDNIKGKELYELIINSNINNYAKGGKAKVSEFVVSKENISSFEVDKWSKPYYTEGNAKELVMTYQYAKLISQNRGLLIKITIPVILFKKFFDDRGINALESFFKLSHKKRKKNLGYTVLISNDGTILKGPYNLFWGLNINQIPNIKFRQFLTHIFSSTPSNTMINEFKNISNSFSVKNEDPLLEGSNYYFIANFEKINLRLLMAFSEQDLLNATTFVMKFTQSFILITMISVLLLLLGTWIICSVLLKPIALLRRDMKKVTQGNFKVNYKPLERKDELGTLSRLFSDMVASLQEHVKQLALSLEEKNKKDRELRSAEYLQNNLLEYSELKENINESELHEADVVLKVMKDIPSNKIDLSLSRKFKMLPDNIKIFRRIIPAHFVSGDFYLYVDMGNDNLFFMIADVSGKGSPAAMVMTAVLTLMRHYLTIHPDVSIKELLESMNQLICNTYDSMFLTTLCGVLNAKTGSIELYNAGHLPPIIIEKKDSYLFQIKPNFPLGVSLKAEYKPMTFQLKSPSTLVLYTDGITEATDAVGELFGQDRLLDLLKRHKRLDGEKVIEIIEATINEFSPDKEQKDDATLLLISWRKSD